MFPFLQNIFGGAPGAAAAVNPEIMFDPAIGKVIAGSLTPGANKPAVPMPQAKPYGGPDMPPLARGTPAPPPEPSLASPLQGAVQNQFSDIGSGHGGGGPGYAPNQFAGIGSGQGTGNPLMDYIRQREAMYRTGGSF